MKRFRVACVFVFLFGGLLLGASFLMGAKAPEQPSPELSAVYGVPHPAEELGWSELDAIRYQFHICGVFSLHDGYVDAYFYNPPENDVLLSLEVYDGESCIGQTGFLKPGEYIQSVPLIEEPDIGTAIQYKVIGYEPDTYYSAGVVTLNTEVS